MNYTSTASGRSSSTPKPYGCQRLMTVVCLLPPCLRVQTGQAVVFLIYPHYMSLPACPGHSARFHLFCEWQLLRRWRILFFPTSLCGTLVFSSASARPLSSPSVVSSVTPPSSPYISHLTLTPYHGIISHITPYTRHMSHPHTNTHHLTHTPLFRLVALLVRDVAGARARARVATGSRGVLPLSL